MPRELEELVPPDRPLRRIAGGAVREQPLADDPGRIESRMDWIEAPSFYSPRWAMRS